MDRYTREQQLDLAHQIVGVLSLAPIDNKIYEHNELDAFISAMRGNEAAVVPFLRTLAVKPGVGVGTRFYINERRLYDRCQFIVTLDTTKRRALADLITVDSDAGRPWYELLKKTGNTVMKGQKLTTTDARAKAKKPRSKPGLVKTWEERTGTAEYITAAMIWGNLNITPAKKAIGMLPDNELSNASQSTIERIFGTRSECLEWLDENL